MKHGYLATMLDMLTGAYVRGDLKPAREESPPRTGIGKLLSIFADGLELIHDVLDTIRLWDDLDKSVGKTLERYGANFGVARDNAPDIIYRVMIKVKVMAQLSGGDFYTVVRAASALCDVDEQEILLKELFPAKIRVLVDSSRLDDEHRALMPTIIRFFKRLVAAGVGFDMGPRVQIDTQVYTAACSTAGHRYTVRACLTPHDKVMEGPVWSAAAGSMRHRYTLDAPLTPRPYTATAPALGGTGSAQGKTYRIEAI